MAKAPPRARGGTLFMIVHLLGGAERITLRRGNAGIFALLHALLEGVAIGKVTEMHAFEAEVEKLVPKRWIGRTLSEREAAVLLEKLGIAQRKMHKNA